MSETTPETGSAEMADEPSMEDILASIRKIIADDDPVVESSASDTAIVEAVPTKIPDGDDIASINSTPALNPMEGREPFDLTEGSMDFDTIDLSEELSEGASFADHMASTAPSSNLTQKQVVEKTSETMSESGTDFDAELDNLMADLDIPFNEDAPSSAPMASPPKSVDASSDENSEMNGAADLSADDVIDLDIEALLSEVDLSSDEMMAPLEDFAVNAADFDDDLDSVLDLEIPMMEEEIALTNVKNSVAADPLPIVAGDTATSDSIDDHDVMALLGSFEEEAASPLTESIDPETNVTLEDDSLFAELEDLLADTSDREAEQQVSVEKQEKVQLDVNLTEEASVSFDSFKANTVDIDNTADDLSESDLDMLLDDLIHEADNEGEAVETVDELSSSMSEDETQNAIETVPEALSFSGDDTDMSLVKSLMADLTESDVVEEDSMSEVSDDFRADVQSETETIDRSDDADFEALLAEMNSEMEGEISSDETDLSALFGDIEEFVEETSKIDSVEISDIENVDEPLIDDSDNVLDDILNMSLDDELAAHDADLNALLEIPEDEAATPLPTPETIAADEAENLASAEPLQTETQPSALSDIASEAEQDAEDVDALLDALNAEDTSTDNVAAIDSALDDLISETVTVDVIAEQPVVEPEATPQNAKLNVPEPNLTVATATTAAGAAAISQNLKETADMPNAALNTDAILDEVTEEASVSAFASLNSVVEEKAIREERGDRIGDLVMEALRPMLKEWLDANLKGIVERAVTKEVKRISSGK